jgi:hypothetical protein
MGHATPGAAEASNTFRAAAAVAAVLTKVRRDIERRSRFILGKLPNPTAQGHTNLKPAPHFRVEFFRNLGINIVYENEILLSLEMGRFGWFGCGGLRRA